MKEKPKFNMSAYSAIIGRIAIALLFILEGVVKVYDFEHFWQTLDLQGFPMAPFISIVVVIIELGGGISLILGFNARFFSFVMAIYLLVVTIVEVQFWSNFDLFHDFLLNIGVIGGLLLVNSHGAGPNSVDESHIFDV
jgi:putative oxidoreductase